MREVYVQGLRERGYQQTGGGAVKLFVRQTTDVCYIVQIIEQEVSVQQLKKIRETVAAAYRSRTDAEIRQMTVFYMQNSDFSQTLRELVSECTGVWLFDETEQRLYCYENQPAEFDSLQELFEAPDKQRQRQAFPTGASIPWVTIALVLINVICFVVPWVTGQYEQWIDAGAIRWDMIKEQGQIYRLFTGMFLHGSWNHLLNNMLVLCILGLYLEPALGHITYSMVYVAAGIFAGVCSAGMQIINGLGGSVGASGAIFGLSGALLALVIFWKGKIPGIKVRQVVMMCVTSLYGGFVTPNVDNAAHIGGLIMGFLLIWVLKHIQKKQ